jgi:restriction system protein
LIGEGFRRQGFSVIENDGPGADGGIDLVLTKGKERSVVQCKHWRRSSVGVAIIREFYGVMISRSISSGFVVTSGRFTPDARGFAAQCGIELIDEERLGAWILQAKQRREEDLLRAGPTPPAPPIVASNPACPICGVDMMLRTARRGELIGTQFWGCSRFPRCRGTVGV